MTSASAADTFLAGFFGPGNDLSLAALADDAPELAAWLDERIARLRQDPASPHVLPRRVANKTMWYAIAHSGRQLKELAQSLEAFLVPAYARIDRRADLSATDLVDAAVLEFTGGHALVLEILAGQQQRARRALEIFDVLDIQRPRRQLALSRPLGRLLREFEMAVLAAAEDTSQDLLGEIERTGQLSAQNIVFLRMRRLAGLRRFDDLLHLPELATVLVIRRPARVSASLLEAVYVTELAGYEASNDPAGALRHFTDVVLRKYPALFRSRHGLQTPEAAKSFMLQALAVRPKDAQLRAQLLSMPDLGPADRRFLERLASLAEAPARAEPTLAAAAVAARAGDYDAALQIGSTQPTSVERAELLIRCAFEIDSIDAMKIAAAAVDDLDAAQRDALTSSKWYAVPWVHITESLSGPPDLFTAETPGSWTDWFQQIVEGPAVANAIHIAERGVVEWSAEEFSAEDGHAVAQLLGQEMAPQAMRTVKDALPHFLQFIDRTDEPARHRELLDDMTVLLLSEEEAGVADVQVIVNLVGSLLEMGVSAARYRQLVGDFCDLWERIDSPAHLDAAIDMLDVLMTQACPDPGAREILFQKLATSFQRWRRRVRLDQWALLADLASELGEFEYIEAVRPADELSGSAPSVAARDALAGQTVAIYSLTETAAARAAGFLRRNFDDVTVELSSDHVASDRLRALARSADVFVLATRSAKHAATTFIEAERPPGRPLVYAAGKGSSSLLRAVLSFISS
jgi:hypothetical protein